MALSKETLNYTRCCYVAVEIFPEILRHILQKDIPPHDIKVRASGLRNLTAEEKSLLRDASSQGYSNFDVTFLYKIIRNINLPSVTVPSNGWGKLPSTTSNNTIGDVIERIRDLRNKIYGHAHSSKINDNDFNYHWSEFNDICQRVDSLFPSSGPAFVSLLGDIKKADFIGGMHNKIAEIINRHIRHENQLERSKQITDVIDESRTQKRKLFRLQSEVRVADQRQKSKRIAEIEGATRSQQPGMTLEDHIEANKEIADIIDQIEADLREMLAEIHSATGSQLLDVTPKALPMEISHMDERSIQIFREAINQGIYKSYIMRLMTIGHFNAGKTTLARRLLGKPVDITSYDSTDGIEISDQHCSYDREKKMWRINQGSIDDLLYSDLVRNLQKHTVDTSVKAAEENIVDKQDSKDDLNIPLNTGTETAEYASVTEEEKNIGTTMQEQNESGAIDIENVGGDDQSLLDEKETDLRNLCKKVIDAGDIDQSALEKILIWDFGGQAALYCTHQGFLSDRALYLLVVDLSKDSQCEIEEDDLDITKKRKCTVIEYIYFWVNSVKFYTGRRNGLPRIIVIGTRLNKTEKSKLDALFEKISSEFKEEIASGQMILKKSFMLDLIEDDQSKYNEVREAISHEAEKLPHWGEELPLSWLPLQNYLDKRRKEGLQILTLKEIESYALSGKKAESLNSPEKVHVCLRFLHSSGSIIYYSRQGLNTHLILSPKMLITTLRSLITCRQFCRTKKREEIHDRLVNKGEISKEDIETIWKEEEFEEMFQNKEYLIKIMQELDLLIMPKQFKSGEIVDGDTFYIPSMIRSMPPPWTEKLASDKSLNHCTFDFTKSFLPPAVIYRFIGSCISMWSPATNDSLFYGGCYLEIDVLHRMLLTTRVDQVKVTFQHRFDNNYISRNTTNNVIDIMTQMMKNVISLYPVKDGDKFENLFSVERSSIEKLKINEEPFEDCVECEGPSEDLLQTRPGILQIMRFSKLWPGAKYDHTHYAIELNVPLSERSRIEQHTSDLKMKVFKYTMYWYHNASGQKSFSTFLKAATPDEHILCKIMKDASDTKQMRHLKTEILEDRCTPDVLNVLESYIGKEYYHFGLEIGLQWHELEKIVHDNDRDLCKINREILATACKKSRLSISNVACALLQVGCGFEDFKNFVNGDVGQSGAGRW